MTQSPSEILGLLARHGLKPRKAYGQHYLADANLIAKVVAMAAVTADDSVIEVGAGTGALTTALAATGARVVAYEIDERFRPLLAETLEGLDVDLRFADIMGVNLAAELVGEWKLVANLPYNVGTPLILEVLRRVPAVTDLVVMVQKEVADRLAAPAGSDEYGLPSVVVALTATVEGRFQVPPQVFVPPPQVASAVVHLRRVVAPDCAEGAIELARLAFGQRRKMLRRSLAGTVTEAMFSAAGVDSSSRPEDLPPQAFVDLARVWRDE